MATATAALLRFGHPGFVGHFQNNWPLKRGDFVVLQGPRGTEIGEVLLAATEASNAVNTDGTIVRLATRDDQSRIAELRDRAQQLLAVAAARATALQLPLTFVDVEATLDETVILHALPWAACDSTALLDELSNRSGLTLRLLNLSATPVSRDEPSPSGCGKPGCGSTDGGSSSCGTSGGCSTGSCSRGAAKTAEDMTAYFADLRRKLQTALSRTPLN